MELKKIIKKDILIAAMTIFIVIIGISIASYSLFFKIDETDQETITYGNLEVSFEQKTDTITRTADFPRTDEEGLESDPFTFTIENTGTLKAKFTIIMDDDENYITENNLTKTDDQYLKYSVNSETANLVSTITNNEVLSSSLEPTSKATYSLRFWLKDDAPNNVIGTSMVKKIKIKSEYIPDSSN